MKRVYFDPPSLVHPKVMQEGHPRVSLSDVKGH